jgi:hypothetical protein
MNIGPVTLTRDSALLWLPVIAGAITYLTNMPPPWHWSYNQWLATAGAGVAALSMKLQNSALPSGSEVARGIRDNGRPLAVLLAIGLAAGASSCASLPINPNSASPRHLVTVTVVSGNAILGALQDGERGLVCGTATAPPAPACVDAERHKAIAADFVTAFSIHRAAAQLVRDTPAGTPTTSDVAKMLGDVAVLIDKILGRMPASPQKDQLLVRAQTIGGQR